VAVFAPQLTLAFQNVGTEITNQQTAVSTAAQAR
jgi:hypothetical protein